MFSSEITDLESFIDSYVVPHNDNLISNYSRTLSFEGGQRPPVTNSDYGNYVPQTSSSGTEFWGDQPRGSDWSAIQKVNQDDQTIDWIKQKQEAYKAAQERLPDWQREIVYSERAAQRRGPSHHQAPPPPLHEPAHSAAQHQQHMGEPTVDRSHHQTDIQTVVTNLIRQNQMTRAQQLPAWVDVTRPPPPIPQNAGMDQQNSFVMTQQNPPQSLPHPHGGQDGVLESMTFQRQPSNDSPHQFYRHGVDVLPGDHFGQQQHRYGENAADWEQQQANFGAFAGTSDNVAMMQNLHGSGQTMLDGNTPLQGNFSLPGPIIHSQQSSDEVFAKTPEPPRGHQSAEAERPPINDPHLIANQLHRTSLSDKVPTQQNAGYEAGPPNRATGDAGNYDFCDIPAEGAKSLSPVGWQQLNQQRDDPNTEKTRSSVPLRSDASAEKSDAYKYGTYQAYYAGGDEPPRTDIQRSRSSEAGSSRPTSATPYLKTSSREGAIDRNSYKPVRQTPAPSALREPPVRSDSWRGEGAEFHRRKEPLRRRSSAADEDMNWRRRDDDPAPARGRSPDRFQKTDPAVRESINDLVRDQRQIASAMQNEERFGGTQIAEGNLESKSRPRYSKQHSSQQPKELSTKKPQQPLHEYQDQKVSTNKMQQRTSSSSSGGGQRAPRNKQPAQVRHEPSSLDGAASGGAINDQLKLSAEDDADLTKFIEMTQAFATSEQKLYQVAEILCNKALRNPKFGRNAAVLCNKMSWMMVEGTKFRSLVLNIMQKHYKTKDKLFAASLKAMTSQNGGNDVTGGWFGFVTFLAQLFLNVRTSSGEHLVVLVSPVYSCLAQMLSSDKVNQMHLECFGRLFEKTGSHLEREDPSRMNALMRDVRDMCVTSCEARVRRVLLRCVELYATRWRRGDDAPRR